MTDSKRTLYIHIGWHKTGTTSIQAALMQNREVLEKQFQIFHPTTGVLGNGHHALARSLLHSDTKDTSLWQQLALELKRNAAWETSIISSESLSVATKEDIEAISTILLPLFNVKVIAYVRQPDQWLEAVFKQLVKGGRYTGTWADFWTKESQKGRPDYLNAIRNWQNFFAVENVIIRPYDQSAWLHHDLINDFFDSIGCAAAGSSTSLIKPARLNISPDMTNLSIVREISLRLKKDGIKSPRALLNINVSKPMQHRLNLTEKKHHPALFFSSKERLELRQQFHQTFDDLGIQFPQNELEAVALEPNELPNFDELPLIDKEQALKAVVLELRANPHIISNLSNEPRLSGIPEYDNLSPTERCEVMMTVISTFLRMLMLHKGSYSQKTTLTSTTAKAITHGKPTLYVHIGHGKVGSSTLQQALAENIDALRMRGLLIADRDLEFPEHGPLNGYPLTCFQELIQDSDKSETRDLFLLKMQALKQTLITGSYRGAIISSEILSSISGATLFKNLTDIFEIHTIYYIRRQDEWLESAWKQWGIKEGIGIREYIENQIQGNSPNFLNVARCWSEISQTIRVVPIATIPDITLDFWDALSLNHFFPTPTARENQTYDWSLLKILSCNPYLFAHIHDNQLFNQLNRLLPATSPREGHGLIPPPLAQKIMQRHQKSNDLLQAEFFPNSQPLYDYSTYTYCKEASLEMDSIAGIYRYLGIELLMLSTLADQQDTTSEKLLHQDNSVHQLTKTVQEIIETVHELNTTLQGVNKTVQELNSIKSDNSDNIKQLQKENKELRKQSKFQNIKIEKIEMEMARSISRKIKKILNAFRRTN